MISPSLHCFELVVVTVPKSYCTVLADQPYSSLHSSTISRLVLQHTHTQLTPHKLTTLERSGQTRINQALHKVHSCSTLDMLQAIPEQPLGPRKSIHAEQQIKAVLFTLTVLTPFCRIVFYIDINICLGFTALNLGMQAFGVSVCAWLCM